VEKIDWRDLADTLGTITWTDHGRSEQGGTGVAAKALTLVLGDDAVRGAVDFYVSGAPGNEVARSVLSMLSPPAAMDRCREIILTSDDEQVAASAANLLQVVADRRVFDWLPELLASKNVGVRAWAVGVIDQLVIMNGEVELEEAMPLLNKALSDPAVQVRDRALQVLEMAEDDARIERLRPNA
jgi:HEAT repeat protein